MHFNYNFLVFIAFSITQTKSGIAINCPYEYTVDLTASKKLQNNSYIFNNDTLLTPDLVQDYNFKILDNGTRLSNREPYKRGCICAAKRCLRFCSKDIMEFYESIASPDVDLIFTKNITLSNGNLIEKHLIHDFYPIFGLMSCKSTKQVFLNENNWILYENGILLRYDTNTNLTQNQHCFDIQEESDDIFTVSPVVCSKVRDRPWYVKTALVASIPFFILILLIYSFSPNVKTIRGKCFITYLALVTMTYAVISFYSRVNLRLTGVPCQIYGYVRYYTQMSCYTWSCILCYDIWNCLTHMTPEQLSFRKYFIIGFSTPSLMTLVAVLITTYFVEMPERWPCTMFSENTTIINIFYDVPSFIVVTYTWIAYIMILVYSRKTKKQQAAYFSEVQKPKLECLMVYFRILLSMGVEWTLLFCFNMLRRIYEFNSEIFDYIISVDTLFTTFQGFIIFLIYIWDSRVRDGIRKRSSAISSSIRRKISGKSSAAEAYELRAPRSFGQRRNASHQAA